MSGIAGIVVREGRTVDEALLRRMAEGMAYRAPDGHHAWSDGRVGFAHALMRNGASTAAAQPCTLDGCVWITADARVDARRDLVRALEAAGRSQVSCSTDAQLILHAYAVWREHCVDHLLGDFAFAIWDGAARRLFCARDPFGIKPFYYAVVDDGIVFSNTLDCVRLHPAVGGALNELAVADFLMFGCHQDPTATTFAKVQRLAPAHVLTSDGSATAARRYWTLPGSGRIRYRRSADYVDHFNALLKDAVDDRINGGPLAVWMSGGLDSTAIAATAQQTLAARGAPSALRAYTVVYQSLFDDCECHFASIAAQAIGIAGHHMPADRSLPFDGWDSGEVATPEPIDDPFHALRARQLREVAADNRVALSGDGGDEIFWRSYVLDLAGRVPTSELVADLARCLFVYRRRPAAGLRARIERWRQKPRPPMPLPRWLNPAWVSERDLKRRFANGGADDESERHPLRPEAQRRLSSALLHSFLEGHDPGVTRVTLEHRWPLLDVRLISYLLAIPPVPWCVDKLLARQALRGLLPDVLLQRPKTPLPADPVRAHFQTSNLSWIDGFVAAPELSRFVNRSAVPPASQIATAADPWIDLRPLCLNYWLLRLNHNAR